VDHLKRTFKDSDFISSAEAYVLAATNGILTSSSSFIMDLLFFILYSTFMLFDPLHINLHKTRKPEQATQDVEEETLAPVSDPVRCSDNMRDSCLQFFYLGQHSSTGLPAERTSLNSVGSATSLMEEPLLGPHGDPVPPAQGSGAPSIERRSSARKPIRRMESGEETHKLSPLNEIQRHIYSIVWHYFMLLNIVNACYAGGASLIYFLLRVDLGLLLPAATFILSFIPELGAIISMILPVPLILLTPTYTCVDMAKHNDTLVNGTRVLFTALAESASATGHTELEDCIDDLPARLTKAGIVVSAMLGLKFLVSNMLASWVMGKDKTLAGAVHGHGEDGEDIAETHAVIVLFAVVFFGQIWGVVGMLISVPTLSVLRLSINLRAAARQHSIMEGP
jgi:predicted PurR-regulated permease PerM